MKYPCPNCGENMTEEMRQTSPDDGEKICIVGNVKRGLKSLKMKNYTEMKGAKMNMSSMTRKEKQI